MNYAMLVGAVALGLTVAPVQAATLLGSFVNDYGSGDGKVDPSGTDVLNADSVTVSDKSTGRFADSFSFGSLSYDSIERFDLILTFDNAGPRGILGLKEIWKARVQGSNSSASSDDLFVTLSDALSPQTIVVSVGTDGGSVDAFAHSVATQTFAFWFSENSFFADSFDLDQAELRVFGHPTAVVPVPAALPLLASGLLGLAAISRRRRAAA